MYKENIEEFGRALAVETKAYLGGGCRVEVKPVIKNNGVVKYGMVIKKKDKNVSPTVYIDGLYEAYQKGMPMSRAVEEAVDAYERCMPEKKVDVSFFKEFDSVRDRLSFKLLGIRENLEYLEDVPYKKFENLAMVPVCVMRNDIIGEGMITIQRSHIDSWGIKEEELWENLMESAVKITPAKVAKMADYLKRSVLGDSDELNMLTVVTNESGIYGAGAVMYPGVLRSISEKYGKNLYVLPSSVHEVIVLPERGEDEERDNLQAIVREVNAGVLGRDDYLSDLVYYYDKDKETLTACV